MSVIILTAVLFFAGMVPHTFSQTASSGKLNLSGAEIAELISETGRRTTVMTGRMADYTYIAETTERKCERGGVVKREMVKTYEAYPAFGRLSVRILLSENGMPVDPNEVERERRRAVSDLIEAEKRAAKAREHPNRGEET